MRITIDNLIFPCELKNKINMKVAKSNLNIKYITGHIIKINQTNLSLSEPHKIIVNNKITTLVAYIYEDNDKIYLPSNNAIISFTKFISILNFMNKNTF